MAAALTCWLQTLIDFDFEIHEKTIENHEALLKAGLDVRVGHRLE